jgi:hypothetical protein
MRPPLTVTLRPNRSMPLTRNIYNVRSSWLGADCTAIITNTPHNTDEACAIVRNLVALEKGNTSILSPPCSGQSGVLSVSVI